MSNYVLVLDANKRQLNPCTPTIAKKLLKAGKASVFRRYPFTIILKKKVKDKPLSYQLKIDPGSKTTGLAILQNNLVIWAAELTHRGEQIKADLETRRAVRRSRRQRKTRYRKPRFLNRKRPDGWLAPSLEHRVLTTMTWVKRLIKFCPIDSIATELVRFDPQKLVDPEISGTEYQKGTLYQYEVREYLLEKFNRTCVYCGAKETPLEVEHIVPKSKGGSNKVSNLTLACVPCNRAKSNQDIKDFLSGKPSLLKRILAHLLAPLKDAAAVNSTRWKLFNSLKETGRTVTTGTGGQTKFNRIQQGLAKTHWLDAACVGETPKLEILTLQPLLIKAKGWGSRRLCRMNKYGFPCSKPRQTYHNGFSTGDLAYGIIPKGKNQGTWLGRVVVQDARRLEIRINGLRIGGTIDKFKKVHAKDGYEYS